MSVGVCVCVCYLVFLSSICSTQWEFHFDYFPPQCHRANLDIVFLNWKQRRPYVSSRIITFVWAIEPEPVAIFSLQSWSATSSKAIASYLYLFGVPVPFSGTLNQNWTNMVHCQVPPSVFFYLSIIRYGAIQGAILSSVTFFRSVGSVRDLLCPFFIFRESRVANEDNVQHWKKNLLHLAYQTWQATVIEIIITLQFAWKIVKVIV